ncbi:ATP-binding protein [Planctomycetaceae bacterium SH139]
MAIASSVLAPSLPNPFLGGIVPDAWRSSAADVREIHSDVFELCLRAVETVRQEARSSSVLIFGEQGSGKTHLLARLQRQLTDTETYPDLEDDWQIFVYLRMRTSSGRIWRKIRSELVMDLMRPMPDGLTQLDHVLAKRLATQCDGHADLALWWEHHRENRMEELIEAWHGLAMELQLRDDFTQVLEWFIRGEHRRHVRAYLCGGLVSEDGFRRLFGNIDPSHYAPDNEDDAFAAVTSLCNIAGPTIPIVFCFDQIEAIEVEDSTRRPVWYLAQAVANLTDETCVAVISCVLANFADNEVRAQDRPRLVSGGQTALARLHSQEMRQVIRSRVRAIAATAKAAGQDDRWPFGDDESLFGSRLTPRELLHAAATRFDQLRGKVVEQGTLPVASPVGEEYEKRVEEAIRTQKPEDTDDLIAATLPQLLPIVEKGWTTEYPVGPHNAQRDIELVLVGPDGEARVGVALCNQPSMTGLAARLNRLLKKRPAFKLQKLVLVRDGRLPITPGAVATRKRIDELTKEDGVLLRPTREVMAVLEAVRSLIADATCGDLAFGGKTIGVSTVRQWLANNLDAVTREWIDEFRLPARPGWLEDSPSDQSGVDTLLDYLSTEPLAPLAKVAQETGLSESQIAELAGSATDRLGMIQGETAILFRVVHASFTANESESFGGGQI